MPTAAQPQIPARPTREKQQQLGSDIPTIPPRPVRHIQRDPSPQRFAGSPLNQIPSHGRQEKQSLYVGDNSSFTELSRPSSVVLPSLGQEGDEYASFSGQEDFGTSPTESRIANDLKLHAPKPSLPVSIAKQRVSTVTRTDSGQAASFGIGKPGSTHSTHDDAESPARPSKARGSFTSHTSSETERPSSSLDNDHGIPQIGQVVPMYPNAGDVQAPSPSPFQQPFTPGIGSHNDGSQPRHHGRRTSARATEIPLDVYGKHGHGPVPHDRFEKAYYQKHPELLKKETGAYHGPFAEGRAEWAMSSDDLNKIVRDTASRGAGLGTSPAIIGTPSEQVGHQATEEYASRISSPRPQSATLHHPQSNAPQGYIDSPLKQEESIPTEGRGKAEFEGTLARSLQVPTDHALESETEDEDTIHVDSHVRQTSSRVYGGASYLESTESLGIVGEQEEEHGYSAPILASDEVAKEPFGYELQPAVSPVHERNNFYDEGHFHARSGSASSLGGSRPSSRPGSIHGAIPSFAVSSSTPLEDLEEYEPLFPEDSNAPSMKKPTTAADKMKRPEAKNRFPSKDIWEDTPTSLQYTATVSTPQLPEDPEEDSRVRRAHATETPEQAFARRQEELAEQESKSTESFLNREKKPWAHKPHLAAETRPSLKQQRFPSRDIWEDTPDSLQLQTTVGGPQSDDKEAPSPIEARPTTGAVVYHQEKAAAGFPLARNEGRATTGLAAVMKPSIPARPARTSRSPEKSQPSVPERPQRTKGVEGTSPPIPMKTKPLVPARPAKPLTRESSEHIPLTTVASNSSVKSNGSDQGSVAAAKAKPPVPSRPVGSKIAALQGGFMSDLNKRLQLGPQAPKKDEVPSEEQEPEKEKAPLVDARKGRARGPARRAPAKSPAPVVESEKVNSYGIFTPSTVFEIDPEDESLLVPAHREEGVPTTESKPQLEAPDLLANIASESLSEQSVKADEPSAVEDVQVGEVEEIQREAVPSGTNDEEPKLAKAADEPITKSASSPGPVGEEEEDMSASISTLKAEPRNGVE